VSRYQKQHSPTHNSPDYQLSFISFLHLLQSIAFFLEPFTSYSMHFFTPILFFSQHMPIPLKLFCCSTEIMSSIPSLSLSSLLGTLSFALTSHPSDHSHLCPLKCHFIFFPYRPGLTLLQHSTSGNLIWGDEGRWTPPMFWFSLTQLHHQHIH